MVTLIAFAQLALHLLNPVSVYAGPGTCAEIHRNGSFQEAAIEGDMQDFDVTTGKEKRELLQKVSSELPPEILVSTVAELKNIFLRSFNEPLKGPVDSTASANKCEDKISVAGDTGGGAVEAGQ